jgi:hypothetical protein
VGVVVGVFVLGLLSVFIIRRQSRKANDDVQDAEDGSTGSPSHIKANQDGASGILGAGLNEHAYNLKYIQPSPSIESSADISMANYALYPLTNDANDASILNQNGSSMPRSVEGDSTNGTFPSRNVNFAKLM